MPCDVKTGMQILMQLKIIVYRLLLMNYNVNIHAWDKELSHMNDSIKQMTLLWELMTESWIKSEVLTMEVQCSELRGREDLAIASFLVVDQFTCFVFVKQFRQFLFIEQSP